MTTNILSFSLPCAGILHFVDDRAQWQGVVRTQKSAVRGHFTIHGTCRPILSSKLARAMTVNHTLIVI